MEYPDLMDSSRSQESDIEAPTLHEHYTPINEKREWYHECVGYVFRRRQWTFVSVGVGGGMDELGTFRLD